MPKAFTFETSGDAYDATQCLDAIQDGDTLVCADGVVGLAYTWPVAVTANFGKLHTLTDGVEPSAFDHAYGSRKGAAVWTRAAILQAVAFAMREGRPLRPEFQPYALEALELVDALPEALDAWGVDALGEA